MDVRFSSVFLLICGCPVFFCGCPVFFIKAGAVICGCPVFLRYFFLANAAGGDLVVRYEKRNNLEHKCLYLK